MIKSRLEQTLLAVLIIAAIATGCTMFCKNPSPPTQTEARAFDIQTNMVPQIVTRTNTVTTTNVVNVPSPTGVPILSTNFVTTTNVVTQTNQVEQYVYNTRPEVQNTVTQFGTAVAPFTAGWGSIVSGALVGLYGLWAHLRSTKKGDTALALTQEIEALRDFVLTLPQGTKIDAAVTQFMQQHQTESGVAQEVLKLIKDNTGDPTVVGVAAQLQNAINDLTNPPAAPNPPKVPAS
jgi:hypothetical protein